MVPVPDGFGEFESGEVDTTSIPMTTTTVVPGCYRAGWAKEADSVKWGQSSLI